MKVTCKHCLPKDGIEVPELSQSEKKEILELTIKSPIHSIKYIIDNFNTTLEEAKYIVTHVNTTYGQCNCCNCETLNEEYVNCPKCGAFNFNWKTD
jgi:hypothetical protein